MPVYKYFGHPARYQGKPLLHLLCNLKSLGKGRIVSRLSEEGKAGGPSFYRVLWAQPLMDTECKEGRVVAQRVARGVREPQPVDLSSIATLPDFRLVPREEEAEFCKWETLRDFSPALDRVTEPKYWTMPPLLRLLVERNLRERGEEAGSETFLLPHYKTYVAKDRETVALPGESRERLLVHQETLTVCEGTQGHSYAHLVQERYPSQAREETTHSHLLPQEPPHPGPVVGMRLHKQLMDHQFNKREELRTEEHNVYFP